MVYVGAKVELIVWNFVVFSDKIRNEMKGGKKMAYETKVIFNLLADSIGRVETVKEAYNVVKRAANVEGVKLPSYEEFQAELKKEKESE
jgi:hypothetical protein